MAREFRDRVQDTTQTVGTGPFLLDLVVIPGQRTFSAHTVGATFDYFAGLGSDWECGVGTLVDATHIARSPAASSNGGALVDFPAGSKVIFETVGANTLAALPSVSKGALTTIGGSRYKLQDAGGLRQSTAKPLVLFNDATVLTLTTSTGATKDTNFSPYLGPGAVTITVPATGGVSVDKPGLNVDLSAEDFFELWVQTPDPTLFNTIVVFFTSDATTGVYTNYKSVNLLANASFAARDIGLNVLRWRVSDMTVGGAPDMTSIKKIRVQFNVTGAGAVINLDSLWSNVRTRSKVCMMFDDGFSEAYDLNSGSGGYTYLKSKGIRGTLALIYSGLNSAGNVTIPQVEEMYRAGWDIIPHGTGFGVPQTNLIDPSWASQDSAIANVKKNRGGIISQGWLGAENLYAYPEGKYTEALVDRMVLEGFKAARTVTPIPIYSYFATDKYMLKMPGIDTGGKTFAQLQVSVDRARATGGSLIFFTHRLQAAAGGTGLFTTFSVYQQLIEYILSLGDMDFVTFSELNAQLRNSTPIVA